MDKQKGVGGPIPLSVPGSVSNAPSEAVHAHPGMMSMPMGMPAAGVSMPVGVSPGMPHGMGAVAGAAGNMQAQHQYASAATNPAAPVGMLGGHGISAGGSGVGMGMGSGVGMGDAWRNMTAAQQQHHRQQLLTFWRTQMQEIERVSENDFKNHQLPLARIKKIMKSDEDVRMISAEAPVLFAKACEMFILELTLRSWNHSEENKRRTLQRNDIAAAITKTDIFDFLVDIVPRDELKEGLFGSRHNNHGAIAEQNAAAVAQMATAPYHQPPPQHPGYYSNVNNPAGPSISGNAVNMGPVVTHGVAGLGANTNVNPSVNVAPSNVQMPHQMMYQQYQQQYVNSPQNMGQRQIDK